ncbi:glycosyltransferase family 4 protein [Salinimicrobium sp. GXAS 041]|uniref:glycosyltransferase family 4 protein n=1 Tax=Salinimicrobium sp. GXAS 041 TaxID=3400806 RepID=UPI003C715BE8
MKKLLVIGYVWPEPGSSAAGSRMMQLLDFFQKRDFEITFATGASLTPFAADLAEKGIKTVKIKVNDAAFDDLIAQIQPEIVLFDRFMMEEQFGWRVSMVCPNALRILDTEDLHFLRKAREMAFKKGISEQDFILESDLTKREIAAIYRCDLSLIISEAEMQLLKDVFNLPDQLLHYLPFMYNEISEEKVASLPGFSERKNFISIGNFLHEPNWNAVLTLKEKIWPHIRKKLPQAEIHIYGAYPSKKVFNLHNPASGFLVKGRAKNSEEVMTAARVCLAPIKFGAGLKGKFIEAMRCGTPSVTTNIGAEGIPGELPWNGGIADDNEAFASAAVELYEDKNAWKQAQENGFKIMNGRFSKMAFEAAFLKKINAIKSNLEDHRRKNFTGAMLQHHLYKSSYYMSRYIELKNQKA